MNQTALSVPNTTTPNLDLPELQLNLQPIRDRFLRLLRVRQDAVLSSLTTAFNEPSQVAKELEQIETVLHKISGSAGTLGFLDLGIRASAVEARLVAYRMGTPSCVDEIYLDVIDFVEQSFDAIEEAA